MIDPEAESAAVRERSSALVALLAASCPTVDLGPVSVVQGEARQLAAAAHAARREVAARVARGEDPGVGVVVGRPPPIRRVRGEGRNPDLDSVLKGRAAITPQLVACIEHQRDRVAVVTEQAYRRAIEGCPFRPALVAAARDQLGLLQLRQNTEDEGGAGLVVAVKAYEASYTALRDEVYAAQNVADQARARLDALRRAEAEALVGDPETQISGFIASAIATAAPDLLIGTDGSTIGTPISK